MKITSPGNCRLFGEEVTIKENVKTVLTVNRQVNTTTSAVN